MATTLGVQVRGREAMTRSRQTGGVAGPDEDRPVPHRGPDRPGRTVLSLGEGEGMDLAGEPCRWGGAGGRGEPRWARQWTTAISSRGQRGGTTSCGRRTSGRSPVGTTAGEARGKGEAEPRTGWPRVEEGEVEEGKDNKGEGDEGRGRRERPIKMC